MTPTPSHEHAPQSIEQTPEAVAEIREQQRLSAVDKLTGEGLELDPEDAYDAYRDFINSIRESAQAGELVTTAQPEPFTEEQILKQYITAFDIQRAGGDVNGIRLIPGARNLRRASLALLGSMAPGSEPSPHAAAVEGMMREAYDSLTHPEAAALTGTEAQAPEVEVIEESPVTPEYSVDDEIHATPEVPQESEGAAVEREIVAQHEAQVRSMADRTAESLATLTGRVAEYEQAGQLSVAAVVAAEGEIATMTQQLARFDDYGVDGARTMLTRMQDQIGSLARYMNVSGQRVEEPGAGIRASEREIRGERDTAERIDSAAARELQLRGSEIAGIDVHDRGAEAVQDVAEDALNTLEPITRVAAELSEDLGQGGTHLNRVYSELEDIIRQSYSTGIDTDQVAHVLRQAVVALDSDGVRRRSGQLMAAVSEAEVVLRAARQQVEQR